MPNKRSKRKQTQRFFCLDCHRRLWRLGSQKHQVDVCKHTNLLAAGGKDYSNNNGSKGLAWTEEFVCEKHGRVQMLVTQQANGTLSTVPAKNRDRHLTTPRESQKAPRIVSRAIVQ